jgi:hypothetical protein
MRHLTFNALLCRKLETTERLLGKHSLAGAADLENRLAHWRKKQVQDATSPVMHLLDGFSIDSIVSWESIFRSLSTLPVCDNQVQIFQFSWRSLSLDTLHAVYDWEISQTRALLDEIIYHVFV